MIIGRIEGATRELGKPADWDDARDGTCGVLAIRDEVQGGLKVMLTVAP